MASRLPLKSIPTLDAILHVEKELLHCLTSNRFKNRKSSGRVATRIKACRNSSPGLNDGGAFQRAQWRRRRRGTKAIKCAVGAAFALSGAHAHPLSQSDGSGFVPTGTADDSEGTEGSPKDWPNASAEMNIAEAKADQF
jgi:hypothetical protein